MKPTKRTDLSAQVRQHEADIAELRRVTNRLGQDIGELRGLIGQTATKADISELHAHMSESLNKILPQALGAVPQKLSLWIAFTIAGLTGTGLIIAVIDLLVRLLR